MNMRGRLNEPKTKNLVTDLLSMYSFRVREKAKNKINRGYVLKMHNLWKEVRSNLECLTRKRLSE